MKINTLTHTINGVQQDAEPTFTKQRNFVSFCMRQYSMRCAGSFFPTKIVLQDYRKDKLYKIQDIQYDYKYDPDANKIAITIASELKYLTSNKDVVYRVCVFTGRPDELKLVMQDDWLAQVVLDTHDRYNFNKLSKKFDKKRTVK